MAVRLPVWVEVPLSKAIESAIKNRKDILKAANILPLIEATKDADQTVRIHVDYLDEIKHEEYRKNMMETFGRPGEYFYDLGSPEWSDFECHHRHDRSNCKCKLPMYHIGQDEAVLNNTHSLQELGVLRVKQS